MQDHSPDIDVLGSNLGHDHLAPVLHAYLLHSRYLDGKM